MSAGEQIHEVAFVKCGGTCEQAATDYEYHGIGDCVMVNMMQNGGPRLVHMDVLEKERV